MKVQKYGFMVLMMVAAEWLLILCNSPPLAAAEGPIIADCPENNDFRCPRERFTITDKTTADEYSRFIGNMIWKHLENGSSHTIPVLRKRTNTHVFVLVELNIVTNNARENVTLAIDAVNVYLVAYRSGERSFFFRGARDGVTSRLFAGTEQRNLRYGGSYLNLERMAKKDRYQISLGKQDLIKAVTSLSQANDSGTQSQSFIVVIQMICEAVRFRNISMRVRQSFGSGGQSFKPDTFMLSLENNWKKLSTRVQQSNGSGVFKTPLELQLDDGNVTTLHNVNDVIRNLSIMLFISKVRSPIMSSHGHDDQNKFRRPDPPLPIKSGGRGSGTNLTVQTNDFTSRQGWFVSNDTSPRDVILVGLRGHCMQKNGTAMWLQKCVSGKQEQIWTLYGDGSIRPKQNQDRCLTCLSDSNSTPVTIESCSRGSSGQIWVFTNEGAILNLKNGMVMNVRLGEIIISPVTGNPNQEWLPLPP